MRELLGLHFTAHLHLVTLHYFAALLVIRSRGEGVKSRSSFPFSVGGKHSEVRVALQGVVEDGDSHEALHMIAEVIDCKIS